MPLIVKPATGPQIDSVPLMLLRSSGLPMRVIVSGLLNAVLSKSIVLGPVAAFARSSS